MGPSRLSATADKRNISIGSDLGPSLLYVEFIQFPQWTGNPRPPGLRTFSIIPLTIWFFELKTPGNFREFLGDHVARVKSSGD